MLIEIATLLEIINQEFKKTHDPKYVALLKDLEQSLKTVLIFKIMGGFKVEDSYPTRLPLDGLI
jgi:hypothetical protein